LGVVADSLINKMVMWIIKAGEKTVTILHRIIIYKYQTPNSPLLLLRRKIASFCLNKIQEQQECPKLLIHNMRLFPPKPESYLTKKSTGTRIKLRIS
jgi:hypothetical protein